jgi:hypothetical protein
MANEFSDVELSIFVFCAVSKFCVHSLPPLVCPSSKMAEAVMLLQCMQEIPSSNLGEDTDYREAFRDYSVTPAKYRNSTLKYVTIAPFDILLNSVVTVI